MSQYSSLSHSLCDLQPTHFTLNPDAPKPEREGANPDTSIVSSLVNATQYSPVSIASGIVHTFGMNRSFDRSIVVVVVVVVVMLTFTGIETGSCQHISIGKVSIWELGM